MTSIELPLAEAINRFGSPWIDPLTRFVSWIPFIIALWAGLAVLALVRDKKNGKLVFWSVLIALILHFAVSEGVIKHWLSDALNLFRERPYLAFPDSINAIGKQFVDSSLPSSHMASTLAVLTVLVAYYRKTWPYALIFALFMAFSRVHNGMHYPTDVLAGSILGLLYGLIALAIAKKILRR